MPHAMIIEDKEVVDMLVEESLYSDTYEVWYDVEVLYVDGSSEIRDVPLDVYDEFMEQDYNPFVGTCAICMNDPMNCTC